MTTEERISQLENQISLALEKIALLSENDTSQQKDISALFGHTGTLLEGLTAIEDQIGSANDDGISINQKMSEQAKMNSELYEHLVTVFNIIKRNNLQ